MRQGRLAGKCTKLNHIIAEYGRVAVAFSGGIDSTYLLHAVCEVLEKDRVMACFADSCLITDASRKNVHHVFLQHFKEKAELKWIRIDPMARKEFVANSPQRCYVCKKNIYQLFLKEIQKNGFSTLVDGTNADDLQGHRPGILAIRELGVDTPLAKVGLKKVEIRKLAKLEGLENYNLPSNSCLATRVETGRALSLEILQGIDKAEKYLTAMGFTGCRVRPFENRTAIELQGKDFRRFVSRRNRNQILSYFDLLGLRNVMVDLKERDDLLPGK